MAERSCAGTDAGFVSMLDGAVPDVHDVCVCFIYINVCIYVFVWPSGVASC